MARRTSVDPGRFITTLPCEYDAKAPPLSSSYVGTGHYIDARRGAKAEPMSGIGRSNLRRTQIKPLARSGSGWGRIIRWGNLRVRDLHARPSSFTIQNAYRARKGRLDVSSRRTDVSHSKSRRLRTSKSAITSSSSSLSFSLPSLLSSPCGCPCVDGLKTQ